jgi:polysaccharide export outer membrane protein
MLRRLQLSLVSSLLVFTGFARAQQSTPAKPPAQQPAAGNTGSSAAKPATTDPNYVIGPQDVLDVSVWKEPELSRSVPVRPDGKISMPLLNDVQAAGLTPMQLTAQITTNLKKYIADPQVTIVITQINSQRIYILGEVNHPGALPLLPGMTMLEALSSAGGFTIFANLKKIYLMRKVNGQEQKYPFNYKDVIRGKSTEQNFTLQPGDTIVVP